MDGIFGSRTEASVIAFQRIFGLTPDGIVGKATWYELVRLYTGLNRLSELRSEGQQFYAGDGIVTKGVEATISNIGRLGKEGMRETNEEIIKMMIGI